MIFISQKKYPLKLLIFNTVMFILIIYFVYHFLSGERGLMAFIRLKSVIEEQNKSLEALKTERIHLENIVNGLNPKTLDLDMLDEIARRELGLIAPDEKMIVLSK